MSEERTSAPRDFDMGLGFESFGVRLVLEADDPDLLSKARETVFKAFGRRVKIFEDEKRRNGRSFGVDYSQGLYRLYKDGVEISAGASERNFFKYLNSALRLEVAEFAQDHVFIHAGVVGWNGTAVILPGTSFAGKSTLTAELVKNGAEYYSDEYAVIDPDGMVKPFPRDISMRYFGATREKDVTPESLGGAQGTNPIPVGMVLFTNFQKGMTWSPAILSPGVGIMEMIPNTLTFRKDPAFSLRVLDLVARRAIMIKGSRGDAKKFAKILLDFFDNNYKLAKMT